MVHLILSKVRGMLKFIFFGVLKHFPFSMLGLQHYILFESYPQLDCSPWMIYQEMKKRGFEKKYKLVWAVEASFVAPKNVCCIPFFGSLSFFQRVKRIYCISNSKLIVDSNRFVEKINKKTFRLYTQHGAPLKNCLSYTQQLGHVDAMLSLSENMVAIEKKIFPSAEGRIFPLGYPTNDRLFSNIDLRKTNFWKECCKIKNKYCKVIGWLPTYRQHRNSGQNHANILFPYGLPLLYTEKTLLVLNQCLVRNNVLLVVPMHHAQAKNFAMYSYSNIVLVTSEMKTRYNVSTADLMQNFDALITDYSAAYHEYVLLNRPIALSIDDYEEYAQSPGFSIDYFDWIKGVYLKTATDLFHFIDDVAKGIDSAKEERELAKCRIHKYIDNKSTQRVVDFLVEKVKL